MKIYKTMDREIKRKWVEALRSGKYKQGRGSLRTTVRGVEAHCCLGVLCDILPEVKWGVNTRRYTVAPDAGGIPNNIRKDFGLVASQQGELISMNDADDASFDEIADYIEKEL